MKREDMGKLAEDQNVKDERLCWYFLNTCMLLSIIIVAFTDIKIWS
jgi:hypothetical protein